MLKKILAAVGIMWVINKVRGSGSRAA